MRVCLLYDCLFPWTVGGAERWLRNVGERLAADGHEVTYVTLRQWDRGEGVHVPGVRVVQAGPRLSLYNDEGRRKIFPPLVFGIGVLLHLLRHGRSYDVVHTASFPFFSVLAAAALQPVHGYRLVVDWHEVWTRSYWRDYLGPVGGPIGAFVQSLCLRVPQRAFCFSRLHARRLMTGRVNGELTQLEGEYAGPREPRPPRPAGQAVVFAGRHIPEKRVTAIVPAVAAARASLPDLRARILGDGPDRPSLLRQIAALGAGGFAEAPGFVAGEEVEEAIATAMCMLLPSSREGYGMVVIEASSAGTPSVVVAGDDNAAVEHVEVGVNGHVAPSAAPGDIAAAIVRVAEGGEALRRSTADWFARNAERLSLDSSIAQVVGSYRDGAASARR